jgi:hypothetical protein
MSRKLSRVLAVVSVLACSSLALAQDGETTTFSFTDMATVLGPILSFIWFIFFIKWGGFRWIA